ncbi:UNVERIFIED_CONTAM: hypothetical protein HDU68_010815 [Siphonaria sp. JEL0065]|nr:hypothetical protein HDU68_010815 [Siphonaria sp. JEL0065]
MESGPQVPGLPSPPAASAATNPVLFDESKNFRFSQEAVRYIAEKVEEEEITSHAKHKQQRSRLAEELNVPDKKIKNYLQNLSSKRRKLEEKEKHAAEVVVANTSTSTPLPSVESIPQTSGTTSIITAKQLIEKKAYTSNSWLEFSSDNLTAKLSIVAEKHPNVPKRELLPLGITELAQDWKALKANDPETAAKYKERAKEKNSRPDLVVSELSQMQQSNVVRDLLAKVVDIQQCLQDLGISSVFNAVIESNSKTYSSTTGASARVLEKLLDRQNLHISEQFATANNMIRFFPSLTKTLGLDLTLAVDKYRTEIKKLINSALGRIGRQPHRALNWNSLAKFKLNKQKFHLKSWPIDIPFRQHLLLAQLNVVLPLLQSQSIELIWGEQCNDSGDASDDEGNIEEDNIVFREERPEFMKLNDEWHGKYGNNINVEWMEGSQHDLDEMKNRMTKNEDGNGILYQVWAQKLCRAKEVSGIMLLADEQHVMNRD